MKNLLSLAVCLLTLVGCTKNVTETQTPRCAKRNSD